MVCIFGVWATIIGYQVCGLPGVEPGEGGDGRAAGPAVHVEVVALGRSVRHPVGHVAVPEHKLRPVGEEQRVLVVPSADGRDREGGGGGGGGVRVR